MQEVQLKRIEFYINDTNFQYKISAGYTIYIARLLIISGYQAGKKVGYWILQKNTFIHYIIL